MSKIFEKFSWVPFLTKYWISSGMDCTVTVHNSGLQDEDVEILMQTRPLGASHLHSCLLCNNLFLLPNGHVMCMWFTQYTRNVG